MHDLLEASKRLKNEKADDERFGRIILRRKSFLWKITKKCNNLISIVDKIQNFYGCPIRAESGECIIEQFIGHKADGYTFKINPHHLWILFTDEFLYILMDTFHSQDKKFRTAGGQHVTSLQLQGQGSFCNQDGNEVTHGFGETTTDEIITAMSHHEHATARNEFVLHSGKKKRQSAKTKW